MYLAFFPSALCGWAPLIIKTQYSTHYYDDSLSSVTEKTDWNDVPKGEYRYLMDQAFLAILPDSPVWEEEQHFKDFLSRENLPHV